MTRQTRQTHATGASFLGVVICQPVPAPVTTRDHNSCGFVNPSHSLDSPLGGREFFFPFFHIHSYLLHAYAFFPFFTCWVLYATPSPFLPHHLLIRPPSLPDSLDICHLLLHSHLLIIQYIVPMPLTLFHHPSSLPVVHPFFPDAQALRQPLVFSLSEVIHCLSYFVFSPFVFFPILTLHLFSPYYSYSSFVSFSSSFLRSSFRSGTSL